MSKAQFAPSAVILALAGDKAAGVQAAFDALQFGLLQIIAHGNNRTLSDTLEGLAVIRGAQGKRVLACVQEAYTEAMNQKNAGKGTPDKGAALAATLTEAARLAYDAECTSDAAARKVKAEATKAAKEKAAKEAAKALRTAAHASKPLTVADALAFIGAACAADDAAALAGVEALVNQYFEVKEATPA